MNPHQRCSQAKVKYRKEPKQVMPKSEDLSRSLEINAIYTFDIMSTLKAQYLLREPFDPLVFFTGFLSK